MRFVLTEGRANEISQQALEVYYYTLNRPERNVLDRKKYMYVYK